ncbi:MAG: M48 family metalloprotease [Candidatus Saccharimonadales bacterium]
MYSEIAHNKRKTALILVLFVAFIGLLAFGYGYYVGSYGFTIGILVGAIIYAAITYYSGSSMALAVNGAQEIQKSDNPRLWRIVENLSITEGMPMPKVYIMNDPAPNAFATGRDPQHAAVCATTGLLDIMTDTELEGVMAHELGHVKNYDIRVNMIAFALSAIISLLADFIIRTIWFSNSENRSGPVLILGIVAAVLSPIVATMIQLAISRSREYLADASGALATRYPEGLASALEKISQYGAPLKKQNTSTAHMFFANPLSKKSFSNLFSTHPPVEERIKRLRDMENHA